MWLLKILSILFLIFSVCQAQPTQFVIVDINQTSVRNAPKFGFNYVAVQATLNGNNKVLYNWLSNYFFLRFLRYPGGTVSSYWDWQAGESNQTLCKSGVVPSQFCHLAAPYTLSYFKNILNYFPEIKPMWDLNCLTASLESQVSLLTEAKNIGLDISHIELGNEYYLGSELTIYYPNGSVYAETMNAWIEKMKSTFSSSLFALIGSTLYDNDGYSGRWNSGVIQAANGNANAYTLHWYLSNLPGCTATCTKVSNDMIPSWFNYTAQVWDGIEKNVVSEWPPKYDIWVTEYNVRDFNSTSGKFGLVVGTWVHALLFAQQTFSLLSSPTNVSVIMPHVLGDSGGWASYLNISTPGNEEYAATPYGLIFGLFTKCGMTATSVYKLTFDPQLNVSANYATNALDGYLFKSLGPEGICTVAINLSNQTASFYVPRLLPQPVEYVPCNTYTISPENFFKQNITEKDLLNTNCQAQVFSPRGITVPPYSFLYLSALVE